MICTNYCYRIEEGIWKSKNYTKIFAERNARRNSMIQAMAWEYHRIKFHVEEDTASPATSLDSGQPTTRRGRAKGNKLQIFELETENPTQISKTRAGPARKVTPAKKSKVAVLDKAKSKCLTRQSLNA